jgi:hypothetical protein
MGTERKLQAQGVNCFLKSTPDMVQKNGLQEVVQCINGTIFKAIAYLNKLQKVCHMSFYTRHTVCLCVTWPFGPSQSGVIDIPSEQGSHCQSNKNIGL